MGPNVFLDSIATHQVFNFPQSGGSRAGQATLTASWTHLSQLSMFEAPLQWASRRSLTPQMSTNLCSSGFWPLTVITDNTKTNSLRIEVISNLTEINSHQSFSRIHKTATFSIICKRYNFDFLTNFLLLFLIVSFTIAPKEFHQSSEKVVKNFHIIKLIIPFFFSISSCTHKEWNHSEYFFNFII